MATHCSRKVLRYKRKIRIRKKISGTSVRPRLVVFRSARHIYAQLINDEEGFTLVAASTLDKDFKSRVSGTEEMTGKTSQAVMVGEIVAERAIDKGIKKVVFDRNGYVYHGRVKAVSDGARKAGLDF